MRTLLFTLALFFTTYSTVLGQVSEIGHDLTVFSEDGVKFTLLINGAPANETPASSVLIKDIHNDYVSATVRFEDDAVPPAEKKYLHIKSAKNQGGYPETTVYKIIRKKDGYVLRFASSSPKKIQQNPQVIIREQSPEAAPQQGVQINNPQININHPHGGR